MSQLPKTHLFPYLWPSRIVAADLSLENRYLQQDSPMTWPNVTTSYKKPKAFRIPNPI